MSYVTFDCTQFISFDSDNEADVTASLKEFEFGDVILQVKPDYTKNGYIK